jgi:hypothetical protein
MTDFLTTHSYFLWKPSESRSLTSLWADRLGDIGERYNPVALRNSVHLIATMRLLPARLIITIVNSIEMQHHPY